MKVKDGVKIYKGIDDIREFEPSKDELFIFLFRDNKGKSHIYVEKAFVRNIAEFWNLDDAIKYVKFKKQESDLNSIIEKYERKTSQLNSLISNLDLRQCEACSNFHLKGHVCYECGYDESTKKVHKIKDNRASFL